MAGSSPRPSRVLIVDDDPFAGLVLSGLFSSALEAVENSSVDLVESKSEVLEAVKAAVLAGAPLDLVRTDTRAHSITCKHAARYHERRDNSSDTLRDKRNTRLYSRTFLSLSLVCRAAFSGLGARGGRDGLGRGARDQRGDDLLAAHGHRQRQRARRHALGRRASRDGGPRLDSQRVAGQAVYGGAGRPAALAGGVTDSDSGLFTSALTRAEYMYRERREREGAEL